MDDLKGLEETALFVHEESTPEVRSDDVLKYRHSIRPEHCKQKNNMEFARGSTVRHRFLSSTFLT